MRVANPSIKILCGAVDNFIMTVPKKAMAFSQSFIKAVNASYMQPSSNSSPGKDKTSCIQWFKAFFSRASTDTSKKSTIDTAKMSQTALEEGIGYVQNYKPIPDFDGKFLKQNFAKLSRSGVATDRTAQEWRGILRRMPASLAGIIQGIKNTQSSNKFQQLLDRKIAGFTVSQWGRSDAAISKYLENASNEEADQIATEFCQFWQDTQRAAKPLIVLAGKERNTRQ